MKTMLSEKRSFLNPHQWIILLLFTFTFSMGHGQMDTLRLEDAFALATQHFDLERADKAYVEMANIEADQLNVNYYPAFSVDGQATYQSDVVSLPFEIPMQEGLDLPHFRSRANIQIEQLIYDGGITKAQKELQAISHTIDRQKLKLKEEQLLEQVAQLYFQILLLQNGKASLKGSLRFLEEKKESLQTAIDRGVAMEADVLQLEAEMINIIQDTSQIHYQLIALRESLAKLIGRDMQFIRLKLPEIVIHPGDTTISDPQLEILAVRKDRLAASVRLSKAQNQPKVNAFASGGLGYPNPFNLFDDSWSPFFTTGIRASWPIWDWGRHKREKERIQLHKSTIDNKARQQEIRIRSGLEKQLGEIWFLRNALAQDSKLLEKRQKIRELMAMRLDKGLISTNDYLQAVNDEQLADLQHRRHKVELAKAKVEYILNSGKTIKN